uniref:Uncharacterized protein n=1 Tax=Cucumis melo TaxID=3656 RepID=A0A9I9EE74_CUCME
MRVNSSPCYHRRQLLPLPHRARASRGTLTLLTTGTLPARDVRYSVSLVPKNDFPPDKYALEIAGKYYYKFLVVD